MAQRAFPFSLDAIHPKEVDEFRRDFGEHYLHMLEVNPGRVAMPQAYERYAEKMYNFDMKSDDVWVCGLRKSGTTWLQEAVWCIMHDADLDMATSESSYARVLVPESEMNREQFETGIKYLKKEGREVDESIVDKIQEVQSLEQFPSPRTIKCHFPLHLLPPHLLDTCRVIYIARNPKDVCVSTYHHTMNFNVGRKDLPFDIYAKWFFRDRIEGGPFWLHVGEAWNKRSHPNMLFIKYEDMKEDLRGALHKIAHFLNKKLSDKQITDLANHLSFENLRKNPTTNLEGLKDLGLFKEGEGRHFIRKGIVGDWVNHSNPQLDKMVDDWCRNARGSCNLHFTGIPLPSKF